MMVLPAMSWSDVGLIVLTAAVLWVPGGAVLIASRTRGWWLAAGSPLVTYGLASIGGPLLSALGLPWRPWALPLLAAVAALLVLGLRRTGRDGTPAPAPWHRAAHVAVGGCVAVAAAIGATAVLVGITTLTAIPQDWDAVFHANGIRWILETGDGSLTGMSQVNWYGTDSSQYYPNAYHLVAATIAALSGRDIPSVLNANTVLVPGLAALGIAALVRACGGRAVVSGGAAVLLVGATAFYDMLWRGPLLPFALGVALIPALLIVLEKYLRSPRWSDRLVMVLPLALVAAGLFGLHPGALIAAALFAVAQVASRWTRGTPRPVRSDLVALLVAAPVAVLAVLPHVLGSLRSAAEASNDWPAVTNLAGGLGEALLFSSANTSVQVWLAVALALGLLTATRLRSVSWLLTPATIFVALFVLASASDAPLVEAVTRPWWNDRFRLIGIAVLPLAVVAAHGLAQTSDSLRRAVEPALSRLPLRQASLPLATLTAAVVLGAYLAVTGGSYLGRNEVRMQNNTGNGPAVSREELVGFQELGRLVPPGQRVMNDRGDGSAWMYAMAGVLPVAGHYYGNGVDPDATLLAQRFDDYDSDLTVRAAAARLNVHWVVVDRGFLRPDAVRQSGLTDLDRVRELRPAYANPDMILYRLDAS